MQELAAIKNAVAPDNILLVVDAMIGQDAVKTAKSFNERLGITGVVLTKLDGDARGGAALSVKEVTGAPIVFVGMGETTDKLEAFRAEGMASRVLGMGDVVGLMKDFEAGRRPEEGRGRRAAHDERQVHARRLPESDADDPEDGVALRTSSRRSRGSAAWFRPARRRTSTTASSSRIEAMIQSMTLFERDDPNALVREPSRVKRIAKGSGQPAEAVSELVQKFLFMRQMMGGFGQNLGLLGNIPGMKNLAMAQEHEEGHARGWLSGDGLPGYGFPRHGRWGPGFRAPAHARSLQGGEERQEESTQARARRAQERQEAMKHHGGKSVALLGALVFACASPPSSDAEKVAPEFQKFALSAVPTDVKNPTFVDFGGKVHLVGWEVSPGERRSAGQHDFPEALLGVREEGSALLSPLHAPHRARRHGPRIQRRGSAPRVGGHGDGQGAALSTERLDAGHRLRRRADLDGAAGGSSRAHAVGRVFRVPNTSAKDGKPRRSASSSSPS